MFIYSHDVYILSYDTIFRIKNTTKKQIDINCSFNVMNCNKYVLRGMLENQRID